MMDSRHVFGFVEPKLHCFSIARERHVRHIIVNVCFVGVHLYAEQN